MSATVTYNCNAPDCSAEDTKVVLFTRVGIGMQFVDDEGASISKVGEGHLCEEHRKAFEDNLAFYLGPNFLQEREDN